MMLHRFRIKRRETGVAQVIKKQLALLWNLIERDVLNA
jgi:hypothetical protein